MIDLDALDVLAEKATPGPWAVGPDSALEPDVGIWTADGKHHVFHSIEVPVEANAAFSAALDPTTARELIRLARIGQQSERFQDYWVGEHPAQVVVPLEPKFVQGSNPD